MGTFDQTWVVYKAGFGDYDDNFWIGNGNLHQLTKNGGCILRIDVWLVNTVNAWLWCEYSGVIIGDEAAGYLLSYGALVGGTISDLLQYSRGYQFSIKDRGPNLPWYLPINQDFGMG